MQVASVQFHFEAGNVPHAARSGCPVLANENDHYRVTIPNDLDVVVIRVQIFSTKYV